MRTAIAVVAVLGSIAIAVAIATGGCVPDDALPPPQYAADAGDLSFPLVRPLANGLLVTPAFIGSDWYLVELDPFASRTRIDGDAIAHGDDDTHARVQIQLGDVTQTVDAELFDARTIPRDGMDIMGVIGRDILRDDYVFGVQRDAGFAWLAKPSEFHPIDAVKPVTYLGGGGAYTSLDVDGVKHFVHVDFESPTDRVQRGAWLEDPLRVDPADLAPAVPEASFTADVSAFGVHDAAHAMFDYHGHDGNGVLGEEFFAPYDLALDRANHQIYLSPRRASKRDTTARIARWGDPPCAHLGCVEVGVEPAGEGAQPRVSVTRDDAAAKQAIEVALIAIDAPDLPPLRVGLPSDVHAVHLPIDRRYAGHALAVTDVSPYPKVCPMSDQSACAYAESADTGAPHRGS
jgi:hypothetical protein